MSPVFDLVPWQMVLTVSDLEKSIAFYEQFGFEASSPVRKPDGRSRVTLTARSAPGVEIKLFTNPNARGLTRTTELAEYLSRVGTRYVSLRCADVDAFYDAFKNTIEFVRPPKDGMTGCRYAFLRDPDGILVEVYQPNYRKPTESAS